MAITDYPITNSLVPPGSLVEFDLDLWILYKGDRDTNQGPASEAWIENKTGKHTAMVIGCDYGLCFYRILLGESTYWISCQACSPLLTKEKRKKKKKSG